MNENNSKFNINSFDLTSAVEVEKTIHAIDLLNRKNMLIHIVKYMHNTILAQTLQTALHKHFPKAKIILLEHNDQTQTSVTVFSLDSETEFVNISDEILKELSLDRDIKDKTIAQYRNQLFHRYFTDHLTDLPNVYQLRKDLENDEDLGLVLIKIDNFQLINNFYGFVIGDYVIDDVGHKLKHLLKEHHVYRLSGAEFAVILKESLGFYDLKEYLNKLYTALRSTIVLYNKIKISVAFTLSSMSDNDTESIISKVSMAMKYAQDNGLPYWIYEDRMNFENEYANNLKFSEVVRKAVDNSTIVPYYQAIVDNKTNKIVKYECLARLVDENQKVISPVLFIPVAKKIKVYNDITKIMIEKSFQTFENSDFEFNVNLSIEDIMNSDVFHFVIEKLKTSKASKRVTFELLESEAIEDFKKVERFINEVKRYGAKIAIDDFGSGFSNFSYLTKMKTDYIKIDGSLIKDIDVDKQALLVVETIVEFAKKLGVKTVAEYVHSSVVMDKVKELGIHYSQGFFIDEPSIKIE